MYVKALSSGIIVLQSGEEYLSINDLPAVVNVSCSMNMSNDFCFEVCTSPVIAK